MRVDFRLYLITDRMQTRGRSLVSVIEDALRGGVRAVQLREKDLPVDELYQLAAELRQITSRYGALLIINTDVDLAREVGADGVHLPENRPSMKEVRTIIGPERLIGVSCHSVASARAAEKCGIDFITFGPVFPTPSKAAYGNPVGLERLAEAARILDIPVFGLGGINEVNARQVMDAGARGIALISAIMAADRPQITASNILELVRTDDGFGVCH